MNMEPIGQVFSPHCKKRGTMRPMVILSSAPVLLVLDIFDRGSNRGASGVGLRLRLFRPVPTYGHQSSHDAINMLFSTLIDLFYILL